MKGTLELANPIMVNNKTVKALEYDTNEITVAMFTEADTRKRRASGSNTTVTMAAEIDYGLHTYLGMMAITAVMQEVDISDLERLKGNDVAAVMQVGRNFFRRSEEPSPPSGSADSSETTPAFSETQPEASESDE